MIGTRVNVHLGNTKVDDTTNHLFNNGVFVGEVTIYLTHAKLSFAGNLRHTGGMKSAATKTPTGGVNDFILTLFVAYLQLAGHFCLLAYHLVRMIVLIFADYTFLQSNGKYFYLIHGAYSDNEEIVEIL
ncbi:hypothetical protein HmCmsJML168_00008 [Escherichia coli]|nr:hypothetical protein HmCmsJML168_00008 [Escherichia coli]GDF53081.1 hypothetical protein HmCmsJML288_00962 [Escherichia coli]